MKNLFITLCLMLSFSAAAGFENLNCLGEVEGKNVKSVTLDKNENSNEFNGEQSGYKFKVLKSESKITLEISSKNELIVSEEYRKDDDLVLSALLDKGLTATVYCYEQIKG
jgi:hypothetical protein